MKRLAFISIFASRWVLEQLCHGIEDNKACETVLNGVSRFPENLVTFLPLR